MDELQVAIKSQNPYVTKNELAQIMKATDKDVS